MTITAIREGSPFDAIRRTREDGAEYWSARDLMAPLGYDKWERFDEARAAREQARRQARIDKLRAQIEALTALDQEAAS